jgi:hypothetical protein
VLIRRTLDSRIFVAAQEVGGLNLLAPHVLRMAKKTLFSLESPAAAIFVPSAPISQAGIIQESSSGDSIYVAASIDNRKTQTLPLYLHSKKNDVGFSVSLDNWVYFPERLSELGPSRIIVYDTYAFDYAQKVFNNYHEIVLEENLYLKNICEEIGQSQSEKISWLFVDARPNLFTVFEKDLHELGCCCSQIKAILEMDEVVTFRSHPGHSRQGCIEYLTSRYHGRLHLSQEVKLSNDLRRHSHVLGSPGYALYVASQANKKVFSTASTNSEWHGPIFNRLSELNL